ncbi:MAG: nuclear transport factor 2 family protein [Bacteroidota bacterium]
MKRVSVLLIVLAMAFGKQGTAQNTTKNELYDILKAQDSLLFNAAFNNCDIGTLNAMFTEDFEFYHDKGGITEGKDAFVGGIAEDCASRDPNAKQPAKRILVPGSLEVYPLFKGGQLYGAIQHGVHTFEFLNENGEYQKGDIAKFTHVWILKDGMWKIKRELSYDHHLQQ